MRGEYAENAIRKDFLPSEIDAIDRAIEPLEREAARERMTAGVNQYTEPWGNFPQGSTGRARDRIGSFAGVSGRTVEKIRAIIDAAKERMSEGGKGGKLSHPSVLDSQGKDRVVDRIGGFADASGRTVALLN